MDKKKVFAILDILETKDTNKIKQAYRDKLVYVNPEDDPEGFKALRQAYEEALRLSEEVEEEEQEALDTPINQWIGKIETIYNNLPSRINIKAWQEIFGEEVCTDFDTSSEAREAFLVFLMDHYRLPKEIWELILQTFQLCTLKEELYESFPPSFIDFVTENPENKAWMNFGWFEGEDALTLDTFIDKYVSIRRMIDYQEYDGIDELIKELEEMDIYHPYLDVEKMRYLLSNNNLEEAKRLAEKLDVRQYDDLYIRYYIAFISFKTDDLEKAYKMSLEILQKNPEHYGAKHLQASYSLEVGEYQSAKEDYLSLLEIDAYDTAAEEGLVKANEELIKFYKKEIENNPDNKKLKLDLGWCLCQNNLYDACINLLKDMVIDRKTEDDIYFDYHNLMSRVYMNMDDYENAYDYIKIWLGEMLKVKDTQSLEGQKRLKRLSYAYYGMAQCFFHFAMEKKDNKEEYNKCIKYIDLAIKEAGREKDLIDYLSVKAYILLKMQEHKYCIDVCDEILRIDNQYFPAYVYRQESYYHLRMPQEVIDDYYHAIEIHPSYPKPYILAIKVFIIYKQYEDAEGVLKRANEADVQSNELKFQQLKLKMQTAQNSKGKRKVAEQMRKFFDQVHSDPGDLEDSSQLFHEIANCYFDMEEYDKALKAIEKRLRLKEDEDSLLLKADTLYNMNKYEEALNSYQQVAKGYNSFIYVYYQIGYCYKKLDQDERAIEYYLKVIEADQEHEYVHDQLMEIYQKRYRENFEKEDHELAVKYGKRQIAINPNSYYYDGLGIVYLDAYEFDEAIKVFKESIKYDETDMYAYCNIGYIYRILGDYDKAYKYYQLAIKHQEDGNLLPYKHLATYYKMTEEYEKAVDTYVKIIEEDKSPLVGANNLAKLYKRMKEWNKAINCYMNLYEMDEIEEVDCLLDVGFVYCFIKPKEALEYYKTAVRKYPKNNKSYYYIGDYMLWIKEDTKEAIKYYEKAYKIIKKYDIDYYEHIDNILFNLLYALKKLGKQQEIMKYIEDVEEFLKKEYGSVEAWLKDPLQRKIRLSHLATWSYFASDYDKSNYYMKQMKEAFNCSTCQYAKCIEYHCLEAMMLELAKDYKGALEKYEMLSQICPDSLFYQSMVKEMKEKVERE